MALTYGFYDSLAGDRVYNAEQLSSIFSGIITDGVVPGYALALDVRADVGMQVVVQSGKAWFNDTWTLNDADFPLTLDASHATLDRFDAIVLEVDTLSSVRANSLKIVKGTNSASPVYPTLINNATTHQYPLCYISVAHTVASITSGMIINKIGTIDCPYIGGVLINMPAKGTSAQVDTGTDDTNFLTSAAIKGSHNVPDVAPGTDGNILVSNGTNWIASALGFRQRGAPVIITASGTYTPDAVVRAILVECWGGGGAGGGAPVCSSNCSLGSGGGGGGYSRKWIERAAFAAPYTVTIGAGGTGVSGAAGNPGGDTSFGTVCIARGGQGGNVLAAGSTLAAVVGGLGGIAGTGDLNLRGSDGLYGLRLDVGNGIPGAGGAAAMSGGLTAGKLTVGVGFAGSAYGGGSPGSLTLTIVRLGTAGIIGVVRVTEFL